MALRLGHPEMLDATDHPWLQEFLPGSHRLAPPLSAPRLAANRSRFFGIPARKDADPATGCRSRFLEGMLCRPLDQGPLQRMAGGLRNRRTGHLDVGSAEEGRDRMPETGPRTGGPP